jgi:hypothetical protein
VAQCTEFVEDATGDSRRKGMSARLMMVVLMAMICFTCVAWGASPREILFDDDVLTAAYKDIENMRYDEL